MANDMPPTGEAIARLGFQVCRGNFTMWASLCQPFNRVTTVQLLYQLTILGSTPACVNPGLTLIPGSGPHFGRYRHVQRPFPLLPHVDRTPDGWRGPRLWRGPPCISRFDKGARPIAFDALDGDWRPPDGGLQFHVLSWFDVSGTTRGCACGWRRSRRPARPRRRLPARRSASSARYHCR